MTLTLVSLSLLVVGTAATKQAGKESAHMVGGVRGYGAAPQTTERNRLVSAGDQAGTSAAGHSATSTITDPVTYWHAKAVKRLRLLGKRERRIVALLVRIHKLRHGSSHATGLAAAWAWYHRKDTQCEVSHEGGWTSVSSGGTYAGRFQMDYSFETSKAFGRSMETRYGRANNWPHWAQVLHAYTVWLDRGWSPWPPYYVYHCGG